MPNTLVAEGMAQCGGLLVSEIYHFSELVVLAKFAKCTFEGEARPGDVIRYHAKIEQAKDFGASVTVQGDIDGRPFSEAEIFFARYDADSSENTRGRVLFNAVDLLRLAPRRRRLRCRHQARRHPPEDRRLPAFFSKVRSLIFCHRVHRGHGEEHEEQKKR